MTIHLRGELFKRVLSTAVLVSYAIFCFYQGPVLLIVTALGVQLKCLNEVLNVAYHVNEKSSGIGQNFRSIAWYLVSAANYFFCCENLSEHFRVFIKRVQILDLLVSYHRFLAFCLYLLGISWFIVNTVRRHEIHQFKFLAFVHVLIIFIVVQAHLVVDSIFNGTVWLLMGSLLVTANDIFSYLFGKLFGRTPLIEVSPKKTWEGYICGAISTILLGFFTSHFFCGIDYLVCPIRFEQSSNGILMNSSCIRTYTFVPREYSINMFDIASVSLTTYPFVLHSLAISLFASIIGSFGGFFASGYKRAFNVKNFGNLIPGHGGFLDRFDCFYLMVTFVSVYINTFVKSQSIEKIYQRFLYMNDESQRQFFNLLQKSLETRLILENVTLIN